MAGEFCFLQSDKAFCPRFLQKGQSPKIFQISIRATCLQRSQFCFEWFLSQWKCPELVSRSACRSRSFDLKDLQWVYGEARSTGPEVGTWAVSGQVGPVSEREVGRLTFF